MCLKLSQKDFIDIVCEAFWRKYNDCLGGCAEEGKEALSKMLEEKHKKENVPLDQETIDKCVAMLGDIMKAKFEKLLTELNK